MPGGIIRSAYTIHNRFVSLQAINNRHAVARTPPAWLTCAHPEVLNRTVDGTRMNHGHRRQYSYNFPFGQSGINGYYGGELMDRIHSFGLSRVRGFSPNFGVMEQQSGANGWDFRMLSPMPLPGQLQLWTMQAVAHGADFVSYFRWRTAVFGTEMYWHGILDYDNLENRRLAEVGEVHQNLMALAEVAGSRYQARVLLLTDWLNDWDGERDLWHGPMAQASQRAIFAAAQHTHTPMDVRVYNEEMTLETLRKYRLVFLPHAAILTQRQAQLLAEYCRCGGQVVMGARTGYKDENGHCRMAPMPGYAGDLCGVTVEEYTLPRPDEKPAVLWRDEAYDVCGFQEALRLADGGCGEAVYDSGWMKDRAAICSKSYPHGGKAWYVGSGFSEPLARTLLQQTGVATPYRDIVVCPEAVELAVRGKDDTDWLFLLNYTRTPQPVQITGNATPVLGAAEEKPVQIEPLRYLVLKTTHTQR